jgi:hypothetical protein
MSTPGPDDCSTVPDTAMGTGSDAGEPGERVDPGDLRPDERALLDELRSADPDEGRPAVEDTPEAARAARDDTVLPAE